MRADWQLPRGTDRGLWEYVQSEPLAQNYDQALAGTPLLEIDLRFAERFCPNPGTLIDLGCGTGRLIVPFAQRGYRCVGVDLSEAMLQVLHEKTQNLPVVGIKANLVELDGFADQTFDYATCLFSTLGMIRGVTHRQQMLKHVHRILKPGGTLIVHVHHRWFRLGRGSGKAGQEPGDRKMPQHHGGAELTLHHFSKKEIYQDLQGAGFTIQHIEPVTLRPDGKLRFPWFFGRLRTYGYLIAATANLTNPRS